MQALKINRDKVVFVNLTEMDKYSGLEANLKGGGRYIEENGYGHEIFNFQNDNGKCYGYTPYYGTLNLRNISDKENRDAFGKYIDDVFVVFTCSREAGGRIVCGFYQHARVYSKPVDDKKSLREIEINGKKDYAGYNIICKTEDAILIDRNDREKQLPSSKSNKGVGHGQYSVWYVNKPDRQKLKNEILDYLEEFINGTNENDEYKYHLHDEGEVRVISTQQIKRSKTARAECIRLKGRQCNICGFDFEKVYGQLGKDYIEVHHITSIGKLSTAEGYEGTDPEKDLIPVCSNCHSMIHKRKEPYRPEEIRAMLDK